MDYLVSDRSYEPPPDTFLLSTALGDALAARGAATQILHGVSLEEAKRGWATLCLTAALMQCAIRDGGEVTRPALVAHLSDFAHSGLPDSGMRTSRSQFLRYAAAEIESLAPTQRLDLIRVLLAATAAADLRQA